MILQNSLSNINFKFLSHLLHNSLKLLPPVSKGFIHNLDLNILSSLNKLKTNILILKNHIFYLPLTANSKSSFAEIKYWDIVTSTRETIAEIRGLYKGNNGGGNKNEGWILRLKGLIKKRTPSLAHNANFGK